MDIPEMTPRRPYLLRAHYEWLLDNELTPHLVVDVNMPGINVPMEYAQDGQIVLNIAPRAVGGLEMTNEWVGFNARFGGIPRQVDVPMAAIIAIYARENGAGLMFEPEPAYDAADEDDIVRTPATDNITLIHDEPAKPAEQETDGNDPEPPTPPRGRPNLRVVK